MRGIKTVLLAALLCLLLGTVAQARQTPLLALTFDDGPSKQFTPQILDLLREKNAKATFFVVGRWLPGKNPLLTRILDEGHQLGNHSFNHPRLTELSSEEIRREMADTEAALSQRTGRTGFMARCPYGGRDQRVLSLLEVSAIHWTIDPAQGRQVPGREMADYILRRARDGDIILLHDSTQANLDATALILDTLQQEGFEFVTVEELLRLRGISPKAGVLYGRLPQPKGPVFDELHLANHWAFDSLWPIINQGLLTTEEGGWQPEHFLTRGEAALALWRLACALGEESSPEDGPHQALLWARERNILRGDKLPDPAEPVTREQFYVMLERMTKPLKRGLGPGQSPVSYQDDRRIADYARPSIARLRGAGFSSADDVELFRPGDSMTRGEAAELLYWRLKRQA